MQGFKNIKIDKDYIAIFASGYSILNIPNEEILKIREKAYTIFINYAPCKFNERQMDCLIWSDKPVSKWLDTYLNVKPGYKFLTREEAFQKAEGKIYAWIDYNFDLVRDKIKGNYTIVWILQLIQKYFPDKKILIFGLDSDGNGKWYDEFTSADKFKRGKNYNIKKKLDECDRQLEKHVKKENVFNCNLESKNTVFQKVSYQEILK